MDKPPNRLMFDVSQEMPPDQKAVLEMAVDLYLDPEYNIPAVGPKLRALYSTVQAMMLENRMREVRAKLKNHPTLTVVLTASVNHAYHMVASLPRGYHTGDIEREFLDECQRTGHREFILSEPGEVTRIVPTTSVSHPLDANRRMGDPRRSTDAEQPETEASADG